MKGVDVFGEPAFVEALINVWGVEDKEHPSFHFVQVVIMEMAVRTCFDLYLGTNWTSNE